MGSSTIKMIGQPFMRGARKINLFSMPVFDACTIPFLNKIFRDRCQAAPLNTRFMETTFMANAL